MRQGCHMATKQRLSGEALAALMIREFGPIRGVQLMGWVLLWALRGKAGRERGALATA